VVFEPSNLKMSLLEKEIVSRIISNTILENTLGYYSQTSVSRIILKIRLDLVGL